MTAQRRIPWKRIITIALALATALLAFGAVNTNRAARNHDMRFEQWLVARPCELAVDFSAPGAWQAPFTQTCDIAHAEPIRLWATDATGAAIEDFAALEGLEGALRILDTTGVIVAESPLPNHPGVIAPPAGAITLARLIPFREGAYQIQVEVTRGAPALAGATQRLTAEYELCGMELLPAQIGYLISAAMGAIAILTGLTACIVALPRRRPAGTLPT